MLVVFRYLGRFSEELEAIKAKHSIKGRKGQQHGARLQAINLTLDRETKLYKTSGLGK